MFLNDEAFLAFYRQSFPLATILPKMHILMEDHVIPWLRKWRIGSGLMGEQGAESIHSRIKHLEQRFNGVVNELDRLKYVVKEHAVECAPEMDPLLPPAKKYKKHMQ